MGKSKCCCCPKTIPHLKFMNLTVDGGFSIPNDDEQVLWKDVQANLVYCIFGSLKDCFNLETGEFTVKEAGLYAITVLPTFTIFGSSGPIPSDGDRRLRVRRTYGSPRCGTSPDQLGQSQVISTISLTNTLMTYSAVQPLAAGDKLDFLAFQTNSGDATTTLFFEFNIVKLSVADQGIFNPSPTLSP